jgi:hypothetical protein
MKKYESKGFILGNCWGGGRASYPAEQISAKSLKELMEKAKIMLKDGSLDSGMGFESLDCALLNITEIETKVIDGKEFTREEFFDEVIGNYSEEDIDFLYECSMY